jgi:quinol monooxygenase YgiN
VNFSVIASFAVAPESVDSFEEKLKKLASITQQEPGCLEYEVQRNSEVEGGYFIVEKYVSYEDYLLHRDSAHILEFRAAVKDLFTQPPIVFRGTKAW